MGQKRFSILEGCCGEGWQAGERSGRSGIGGMTYANIPGAEGRGGCPASPTVLSVLQKDPSGCSEEATGGH